MKRNKIAAGALALALGLGAVAPTFAATADTAVKTTVSGPQMFAERYAAELKKANELKADADAKKARLDKAEVELAKAEERVLEAAKAYNAIKVDEYDATLLKELQQARLALASVAYLDGKTTTAAAIEALEPKAVEVEAKFPALRVVGDNIVGYTFELTGKYVPITWTGGPVAKSRFTAIEDKVSTSYYETAPLVNAAYTVAHTSAVDNGYSTDTRAASGYGLYVKADGVTGTNNIADAKVVSTVKWTNPETSDYRASVFSAAYERYANAWNIYEKTVKGRASQKAEAYQKLVEAERAYDVAKTEEKNARKAADPALALYNEALRKLHAAAAAYNVTLEATDKGIEVKGLVKETPAKDNTQALKELQETVNKAKVTLESVKTLKRIMPKTAKANTAKLDKLVAEQEALVKEAEAVLKANGFSVANLFVSTAFAGETTRTPEQIKADLEAKNEEIEGEMSNLDADVAEESTEETKDSSDDKKEDDKKEDNKDDKAEKTTTVVAPATTNKTAGSNAKTGIAGVAGVAGVLAAASVAYAASKKN